MLGKIFELQKAFQLALGTLPEDVGSMSTKDNTNFIKDHAQYADQEMHEMLRELQNFKPWKTYNWTEEEKAAQLKKARGEFIDVFHFIVNIALALGMSAEDVFIGYCYKNNINYKRQESGY